MRHKARVATAIRSLKDLGQEDVVAIELLAQATRQALKVIGARTTFHVLQGQMSLVMDEVGREYLKAEQEQRRAQVALYVQERVALNGKQEVA